MKDLFINNNISQSSFIAVSDIPFTAKAASYCSANLCGRYGKTWSCPPATGDFESCVRKTAKYKKSFVFACKDRIEDLSDENKIDKLRNKTMNILFGFCEELDNMQKEYLALGCGSCNICENCTYPDAPCRFPEKAVPPMEAYGIDVAELCKKTGMTYLSANNEVTFFCIIMYNE